MRIQSITVNGYRSFGVQQNMLQVNPGVTPYPRSGCACARQL